MPDIALINALIAAFKADPSMVVQWAILGFVLLVTAAGVTWRMGVSSGDRTVREKDATIEALRERLTNRGEDFERAQRDQAKAETSLAVLKGEIGRLQEAYKATQAPFIWGKLEDATASATASVSSVGSYLAGVAQQDDVALRARESRATQLGKASFTLKPKD